MMMQEQDPNMQIDPSQMQQMTEEQLQQLQMLQ